jgi:predicted methyltransferase
LAANPEIYDRVQVIEFAPPRKPALGPDGSADMVVTFRNVHNWMEDNLEQDYFRAMFKVLKPGGVLGLVEHRGKPSTTRAQTKDIGYVPQDDVIKMVEQAGFRLLESSEINANKRDTKDHPNGVWSLPPTLEEKDKDRAKYLAIGESDRMTLKFIKP